MTSTSAADRALFGRGASVVGAVLISSGWFFLVAGTGGFLMIVGVLALVASLVLDHTRWGVTANAAALLVGFAPLALLLVLLAL